MTSPHADVASPYAALMHFEIVERSKGVCRIVCELRDGHRNRRGVMHGGVLLGLMDHTAGLADSWTEPGEALRLSATIDLTGRFTRPVTAGRVTVVSRIVSEGRSIYFASTEIHDEAGHLVAFGSSTHKRVKGTDNEKT